MTDFKRIELGQYPTPIQPLDVRSAVSPHATAVDNLWIKRDDLTAPEYGGNKVRKLEYLLADARAAGKSRLVTIGAAGSHQVVATTHYGRREGFEVEAVLVPQPFSEHGVDNLRAALAGGLIVTPSSSWAAAPAHLAMRLAHSGTYHVPLGGSSALASYGFALAAEELSRQVASGAMPEPDVLVVAMGSGGTAAGLAAGLERARMRTRVLAVAISPPARVLGAMTRRLTRKTAELMGEPRRVAAHAVDRVEVESGFLGRGYGYSTPAGEEATRIAERLGLHLDVTYTSKALACALAKASKHPKETVLFWHTLSAAPLAPLLRDAPPELPSELAALFKEGAPRLSG